MSNTYPGSPSPFDYDPELGELDRLSNSVVDLIKAGRFDDAERVCREGSRKYPEVIDQAIERLESHRN